jgi:hypothetical protein
MVNIKLTDAPQEILLLNHLVLRNQINLKNHGSDSWLRGLVQSN